MEEQLKLKLKQALADIEAGQFDGAPGLIALLLAVEPQKQSKARSFRGVSRKLSQSINGLLSALDGPQVIEARREVGQAYAALLNQRAA